MHLGGAGLFVAERDLLFALEPRRAFFLCSFAARATNFCLIKSLGLAAPVAARCRPSGAYLSRPVPPIPPLRFLNPLIHVRTCGGWISGWDGLAAGSCHTPPKPSRLRG